MRLSGDLFGPLGAYALAAGVLAAVDSAGPAGAGLLNARQSLVQEQAALDAVGADPKITAASRLNAFAATLSLARPRVTSASGQATWEKPLYSA